MAHPTTSSTERALSVTGRPQCPAPSRRSADPTAAAALTNDRRKHRRNCPHARTQAGKKKRKKRKEVEGRTSSTRSHHGRQPPQQQHFRTHHDAPPPPPCACHQRTGSRGNQRLEGDRSTVNPMLLSSFAPPRTSPKPGVVCSHTSVHPSTQHRSRRQTAGWLVGWV